jgi:hypothetical protein
VIGDYDIEGMRAGGHFDERFPAVRCPGHFSHRSAQHHGEDLGDSFFVLDRQYL